MPRGREPDGWLDRGATTTTGPSRCRRNSGIETPQNSHQECALVAPERCLQSRFCPHERQRHIVVDTLLSRAYGAKSAGKVRGSGDRQTAGVNEVTPIEGVGEVAVGGGLIAGLRDAEYGDSGGLECVGTMCRSFARLRKGARSQKSSR
jgi:hypothetical protein